MKAIILAAGRGSRLHKSRLRKSVPKALTVLRNGKTILENQLDNLRRYCDMDDVMVVVGFRKELIMEFAPTLIYVYNHLFRSNNTGKSILCALKKVKNEDVLWLNGDVVFDHRIIGMILAQNLSCMAVNRAAVRDEEIKYRVDERGFIREVSKNIKEGALGEAVGVNFVRAVDLPLLRDSLAQCGTNDYFEKGIEMAIERGMRVWPVDISDLKCVEVDFPEDLEKANSFFAEDARGM